MKSKSDPVNQPEGTAVCFAEMLHNIIIINNNNNTTNYKAP